MDKKKIKFDLVNRDFPKELKDDFEKVADNFEREKEEKKKEKDNK